MNWLVKVGEAVSRRTIKGSTYRSLSNGPVFYPRRFEASIDTGVTFEAWLKEKTNLNKMVLYYKDANGFDIAAWPSPLFQDFIRKGAQSCLGRKMTGTRIKDFQDNVILCNPESSISLEPKFRGALDVDTTYGSDLSNFKKLIEDTIFTPTGLSFSHMDAALDIGPQFDRALLLDMLKYPAFQTCGGMSDFFSSTYQYLCTNRYKSYASYFNTKTVIMPSWKDYIDKHLLNAMELFQFRSHLRLPSPPQYYPLVTPMYDGMFPSHLVKMIRHSLQHKLKISETLHSAGHPDVFGLQSKNPVLYFLLILPDICIKNLYKLSLDCQNPVFE